MLCEHRIYKHRYIHIHFSPIWWVHPLCAPLSHLWLFIPHFSYPSFVYISPVTYFTSPVMATHTRHYGIQSVCVCHAASCFHDAAWRFFYSAHYVSLRRLPLHRELSRHFLLSVHLVLLERMPLSHAVDVISLTRSAIAFHLHFQRFLFHLTFDLFKSYTTYFSYNI